MKRYPREFDRYKLGGISIPFHPIPYSCVATHDVGGFQCLFSASKRRPPTTEVMGSSPVSTI